MNQYIVQSLPECKGIKPRMFPDPRKFSDKRMIFHADLNKIITFWRFETGCIPSFINKNELHAGMNPKEKKEFKQLSLWEFIRSIFRRKRLKKYEITEIKKNFHKKYKAGEKFKNSTQYTDRHIWLYHDHNSSKDPTPMMMPVISFNKSDSSKEFKITTLINDNELKVFDSSEFNIGFENGRHRTRFLEFIGAKDIYVIIEKNQLEWFNEYCAYKSEQL